MAFPLSPHTEVALIAVTVGVGCTVKTTELAAVNVLGQEGMSVLSMVPITKDWPLLLEVKVILKLALPLESAIIPVLF
ncbi:hypothetical protein D9M68_466990 [compost metagenome]